MTSAMGYGDGCLAVGQAVDIRQWRCEAGCNDDTLQRRLHFSFCSFTHGTEWTQGPPEAATQELGRVLLSQTSTQFEDPVPLPTGTLPPRKAPR